ncbi:MAG TPA: GntR family transcriptional regulator [Alphaproteobacteria bacterium]|nr:GntR family transcriptional regulator [Alphaproteobacteria bacterium]
MSNAAGSLRVERTTKTLRALALEKLRSAILTQHFKPGARLVERTLCEELGVSRTVVREALRHLEAEGLVESVPQQGPVVARVDRDAASQLYELRAALEALAARAAAEIASAADIESMSRSLDRIEQGYASGDMSAVLEATTAFYESMFLSGGKTVAWTIVQSLNARITTLRALTIGSSGRNRQGPLEMRRILEALKRRDAAAAEVAALEHVRAAGKIALTLLRDGDR